MAIMASECFMIKLYYKKWFVSKFDRLVDILYRASTAYSAQIRLFVGYCPGHRPA